MKIAFIIILVVLAVGLLTMERIDPSKYETDIDCGTLSAEQIRVMNNILECSKTGNTTIEQNLKTNEEFREVIDYIGLYFGTNLKHQNVALWRPGYAIVELELLRELEQDKAVLDAKIDRALSMMYEGSDRFKLWQISEYLALVIAPSYSLDHIEPLSGLAGKGSCMTYSMLFYKMARRVGIEVYICEGYVHNGIRLTAHSWNMVMLDGEQYFYDATWYDCIFIRNLKYIHSQTAWGRSYTIPRHYSTE